MIFKIIRCVILLSVLGFYSLIVENLHTSAFQSSFKLSPKYSRERNVYPTIQLFSRHAVTNSDQSSGGWKNDRSVSLPTILNSSIHGGDNQNIGAYQRLRKTPLKYGVGFILVAPILVFIFNSFFDGAWRFFLSGGICAATSHAITTPIDVVKTRQQVEVSLKDIGMVKSTLKIIKDDGAQALLTGLGPTTFGYLLEGATKFGVYESMKPAISQALCFFATTFSMPSLNSKVLNFIICGGISGLFASIVLCPMEVLRIRLVADPNFATDGWINGGINMAKNEGMQGVKRSLASVMCKQIPYTITKNVSFDLITTMAYSYVKTMGYGISKWTKLVIPLGSAIIASILACISSQPGDMLMSVINSQQSDKKTREFAKDIIKESGIKGFFIGINSRFIHVGIIVTLQLLIYDFVKQLCGIVATGL